MAITLITHDSLMI